MNDRSIAGFDWDDGNEEHCRKHGVTLDEIEQALRHGPLVMPDRTRSAETRFNAVGRNADGRHLFIVFTLRAKSDGMTKIRPISARYMHAAEVEAYDQTKET